MRRGVLWCWLVGFAALAAWMAGPLVGAEPELPPVAEERLFAHRVWPLLQAKCLPCHGNKPEELKGKLDLRTRETALAGGESGEAALVSREPDRSLLFQAIRWDGLKMPPKANDRLSASEIDEVRRWIAGGAPWPNAARRQEILARWPDEARQGVKVKTSGGTSQAWSQRTYEVDDLWAYRPLARPAIPYNSLAPGAPRHPIDAFLQQKLDAMHFEPAPAAERADLVRRATFDLTGLPPSAALQEKFGASEGSASYEQLLDELLASPRYGERMAQHWLDVVRYADTDGFSNDYERPHAWRYRDYVVRSFAADKPYNRFVLEQIAGDELDSQNSELLVAVGFLRMGPWEHTSMSVAAVTRQMFLDDVTNSVGITFLGQGLSCCRCHDHKFDPLPTRDYYRLQAALAGTFFADRPAPFAAGEVPPDAKVQTDFLARQQQGEAVRALEGDEGDALSRVKKKRGEYLARAAQRYEPVAFSVENRAAGEVRILVGGRLESPSEPVGPGVLSAVSELGECAEPEMPAEPRGRRLAVAHWIASDRNPLTARVIVNRIWQQHFGQGLVATPNNFGKMGKRPSHPELLDWLSGWLIQEGWSLKNLHRLIMTSAAYQRSARHAQYAKLQQVDPKNQLLAYFAPRRLSADELRDALLFASGELRLASGGPGVFPEINREVALQPRHVMGGVAPAWMPSRTRDERHRRTLYAFRTRTLSDPLLEVFNQPGSDLSCERREESNVPTQALELLNGHFARDRSLALAADLAQLEIPTEGRIAAAFRRILGRNPTPEQLARCQRHYDEMLAQHKAQQPAVERLPQTVEREMIAEQTGRLFRWEERLDWENFEPDFKPSQAAAPVRALAEVCLVLFNANEFLYVY